MGANTLRAPSALKMVNCALRSRRDLYPSKIHESDPKAEKK